MPSSWVAEIWIFLYVVLWKAPLVILLLVAWEASSASVFVTSVETVPFAVSVTL